MKLIISLIENAGIRSVPFEKRRTVIDMFSDERASIVADAGMIHLTGHRISVNYFKKW